jgi:hypothetical protein
VTEITVLGSQHALAKNCLKWEYPFPNFLNIDLLIINTNTLRTAMKKDPALKNALFNEAQRHIFDALMTREMQIVVVMPSIPTDLRWLPIYPDYRCVAPTKTERTPDSQVINEYLENVETASYYFQGMKFAFLSQTNAKSNPSKSAYEHYLTKLQHTRLILNTAKQVVGGSYEAEITYRQTYMGSLINEQHYVSSPITFLPPPTKVSVERGIDVLINIVTAKIENGESHMEDESTEKPRNLGLIY